MSSHVASELDPFRVAISLASETNSADLFIETFNGAGLTFDVTLAGKEDFSHTYRIRALLPRVIEAYDRLSPEARLAAANAALGRFVRHRPRSRENASAALHKIGWGFQDDRLVTLDPQVREMFFPRGSQWDAFVAIRELIDTARSELML